MAQGTDAFKKGAFPQAIADWEEASRLFEKEKQEKQRADCLVKLSQAYLFVGQLGDAFKRANQALEIAAVSGDTSLLAAVYGALGNLRLSYGESDEAHRFLMESLSQARASGNPELVGNALHNLGNLHTMQQRHADAATAYKQSVRQFSQSGNAAMGATACINSAMAQIHNGAVDDAQHLLDAASGMLATLEPTYFKAHGLINLGLGYRELEKSLPDQHTRYFPLILGALRQSQAVAETLQDHRTASYALGYLGNLHEEQQRYAEALSFTQRAVFAAQQVQAPVSLYRWQWQAGRLLRHLGAPDEALSAYRSALNTLEAIREGFTNCYGKPQQHYHKVAGSICAERVEILLDQASKTADSEQATPYLIEARETLELLKAYELRDYFQDDCVDAFRSATVRLDTISRTAVVVYPILLKDRIDILATLPSGLTRFSVPVGMDVVRREVVALRKKLEKRTTWEFLPHAQQLYRWLIGPLEQHLHAHHIDTLVFVPDGPLRLIPMASLHDGKNFLVENYAVAVTPGLDLTDPRPLARDGLRVLAFGLTESVQGFASLPYVAAELNTLEKTLQCTSLRDRAFSLNGMEAALQGRQYNIVHVASHGEFGGQVNDSFLLAFDDRVTMDRLKEWIGLFRFRDEPLELLTLSACETAAGDDRAALGLAGVAIKAGASSALATLWHVNDPASSELISTFYGELKDPAVSRAKALQRAQLALLGDLRYRHPGYWSCFLLINNWL